MPILDFKEIPAAHVASGEQDTFEMFARDFLSYLGYEVIDGPDRGADGGRDILLRETRAGVGGETTVRWLVSCKHKAHSGKSVTSEEELDIGDRIAKFACQGFIAFYSTIPSSGLAGKLKFEVLKAEVQVFDRERIEQKLLGSPSGVELAGRYFPESIRVLIRENPSPVRIFDEEPALLCANCQQNLLLPDAGGILVLWRRPSDDERTDGERFEDIYWCCKGHCDDVLGRSRRGEGWVDSWEDIPDVTIPTVYIKWVMAVLNELQGGAEYSTSAFARIKDFFLQVFPSVARHLTTREKDRLNSLRKIPAYLGGMGDS